MLADGASRGPGLSCGRVCVQPAENEMITVIHFHLHHPIMLGKKKTQDVQFYAEVMDVVQTINSGRRAM